MKSIKVNAILNVIQNICKIIFPLITIPYASRILGSAGYGMVSFGNSVVRYFILIAALGISTYSQREASCFREDKKKFTTFANQVFTINVVSTIVSYSLLAITLIVSYKLHDYWTLILIQSSAIILGTIGADWVNVIHEDYFYITIRYILIQIVSLLFLFLFVKTPNDYYNYAIINVVASAGGNIFNTIHVRQYVKLHLVNPKDCLKHLRPIIILFCVSITTVIYISSDVTIIGFYMTDSDVGVYTMASNIYSVVKQVISAILTVSIPRLAYYLGNQRQEEYIILAKKVLNTLISLLLPAIVGLALLSKHILFLMGGSEYVSGQNSLMVLSLALLFAILAGFYSNGYLLISKKDKTYLVATVTSAVVNIALNFLLIPLIGILGAAFTTLIAEIIMTAFASRNAISEYKLMVNKQTVFSALIGSFVVSVLCIVFIYLRMNSFLTLALSSILSVIVYYLIMKAFRNPLADSVDAIIYRVINMVRRNNH